MIINLRKGQKFTQHDGVEFTAPYDGAFLDESVPANDNPYEIKKTFFYKGLEGPYTIQVPNPYSITWHGDIPPLGTDSSGEVPLEPPTSSTIEGIRNAVDLVRRRGFNVTEREHERRVLGNFVSNHALQQHQAAIEGLQRQHDRLRGQGASNYGPMYAIQQEIDRLNHEVRSNQLLLSQPNITINTDGTGTINFIEGEEDEY